MLVTMRPWMPRRRLALAAKCIICRSLDCDWEAARAAEKAASTDFDAAVLGRTDRTGLYPALKAATARLNKARAECCARGNEHDRQMDIFIAALKVYVAKDTYLATCAISEGVRQSMQPKQCGATMLCMRGAR